jgi:hypothetical protein
MIRFLSFLVEKGFAAQGFNYEKQHVKNLQDKGLMSRTAKAAGSSADAPDATIQIKGNTHSLEIKKDRNAFMGQAELHHNDEKGWHVSPNTEKKYPGTTKYLAKTGFLKKINKQWGKPSGDYDTDRKMGNVYHTEPGVEGIATHYGHDRETPYMQIGGHGLMHVGKDEAKLGTTKLSGNTQLRARMKYRGTDKKTGKKKYGALIVMNLKNPPKSKIDLDNPEHVSALTAKK